MVTLGTGIGSGVFLDGALLPNTELGHLLLNKGEAEDWAAESVREQGEPVLARLGQARPAVSGTLQGLFWPDLIIIGGGASKKADKWLAGVHVDCEVVPASLLNDAGIVGAAMSAPA